MPLTDAAVKAAKPREKPYKLSDARGLYLLINPSGAKWWRFKYRFGGKEKLLSFGVYPDVSLRAARARRDGDASLQPDGTSRTKPDQQKLMGARELIAMGIDPSANRQAQKAALFTRTDNSFEVVAREWFAKYSGGWSAGHGSKILRRLEKDVFPWVGNRPIADLTPPELLACLRRIEGRGAHETAHRAHQNCGQVFRYAIATGRAERDISVDLRGSLTPAVVEHHASLTDPKEIGALLRSIDGYQGSLPTKSALRLAPLVFLRPGELRHGEWTEISLDKAEWRIPAEKMKARASHIVPLSKQATAILKELQPLTGRGRYLFPSIRTGNRPMSENTINAALRRLGYTNEEMTGHGFRSLASTLLNEHGWNRDAVERQLAHAERDTTRAAYNYAEFMPERKRMMQWWSEYLGALREDTKPPKPPHMKG
jgi:integrase